jgi:hypothetical protein
MFLLCQKIFRNSKTGFLKVLKSTDTGTLRKAWDELTYHLDVGTVTRTAHTGQ